VNQATAAQPERERHHQPRVIERDRERRHEHRRPAMMPSQPHTALAPGRARAPTPEKTQALGATQEGPASLT
jgi:hypothetical protein